MFFVLSGYVLAPQILLILSTRKLGTLWTFLMRRWMRTVPAYLVALLLVSAFAHALGSADFWHYLFYVQNLFWQDTKRDYYSIAWSLSVEEWFYLTFPLFLLAASFGRGRGIRYYAVAAILFILSITILRTMLGNGDDWGAAVRRVVVFRIDSIAYGFLLILGTTWTIGAPAVAVLCRTYSVGNTDVLLAQYRRGKPRRTAGLSAGSRGVRCTRDPERLELRGVGRTAASDLQYCRRHLLCRLSLSSIGDLRSGSAALDIMARRHRFYRRYFAFGRDQHLWSGKADLGDAAEIFG